MNQTTHRCHWAKQHPLCEDDHDRCWGVPMVDDRALFEQLTLESAQAGLSWLTILKKRAAYREAFAHFDIEAVAAFTNDDVARCLDDSGIVRHRQKIEAAVNNARCILRVQKEHGSFSDYLWRWVDYTPLQPNFVQEADVPAKTELSNALSKALKQLGFQFVGPTTCYAFMQAIGMSNDHTVACFRHHALNKSGPVSPPR